MVGTLVKPAKNGNYDYLARDAQILALLPSRAGPIKDALKVSDAVVRNRLRDMEAAGIVYREGRRSETIWYRK